eukprot:11189435-Lingulodinium_polyedra.AAC.1
MPPCSGRAGCAGCRPRSGKRRTARGLCPTAPPRSWTPWPATLTARNGPARALPDGVTQRLWPRRLGAQRRPSE